MRPFSPFRSCVLPTQRVPANFQYFSEHADAIAQWVDARAFPMRPCHRDLRDSKTKLPRQEKQFGVESPALNLLLRKNHLRRAPGERFKTALGVLESQPQNDPQQQIEYPPEKLAIEWLLLSLQFALQPA